MELLQMKLAPNKGISTPPFQLHPSNVKHLMKKNLPESIQNILKLVGEVGDLLKINVYVVGGFVRDLLLEKPTFDIDIVVEGDGIEFAKKLTQKTLCEYKSYGRFKTAKVVFQDGFKIDIASARQESYKHPASLPDVMTTCGIYNDIYRRDFTINAMAIQLNSTYYANLIDFVGGENDLKEGVIRVLHDKSFIDDPTRIFRAIRFASRHRFRLAQKTKDLIIKSADVLLHLTKQRLREELMLILNDDNPSEAILELHNLDILKYVHPSLQFEKVQLTLFKKIAHTLFYFELIIGNRPLQKWLIYLLALIDKLSNKETLDFMKDLRFTKLQQQIVIQDKESSQTLMNFLKAHKIPTPSELYQHLIGIPLEMLVFIIAKVEAFEKEEVAYQIKKHIAFFLTELDNVKISITGDDLKKLGFKPGPIYKEILDKVLVAKLDGKVRSKKEELKYVSKMKHT